MSLRSYFGRNEGVAVFSLVLMIVLLGLGFIVFVYAPFTTAYSHIMVNYEERGDMLHITEQLDARVVLNSYNVLYRSFAEDVCKQGCNIMIDSVTCARGIPYYAMSSGAPLDPVTGALTSVDPAKVQRNEIGCYLGSGYSGGGTETITVAYDVPIAHVQRNQNRHIIFSDEHFPVNKITVNGLGGSDSRSFLPDGRLWADVNSGKIGNSGLPISAVLIACIILATVPLAIWKLFGTEKPVVVAQYLHVIPDKTMEPWKVDVLVNGNSATITKNGMASILMEMYAQGVLTTEEQSGFLQKKYLLVIRKDFMSAQISAKAKDFAQHMMSYKKEDRGDAVVCEIPTGIKAMGFSRYMREFFQKGDVKAFGKDSLNKTGLILFGIFTFLMVFSFVIGITLLSGSSALAIVLLVIMSLLGSQIPASVFARFKGDYYRKYLEWNAFGNMLKDYAQIKKYLKEDYVMWKEWLVYGTALGHADKLIKSLKELRVLNDAQYDSLVHTHATLNAIALSTYSTANPKGGGGGGIGGGGGFGGGGGGGR